MDTPEQWHVTVSSADHNAVNLLANASGLSAQWVKQAMQKGCVWYTRNKHTQRLRRSKKALQVGDEIHFYYNSQVLNQEVDDAILIDDQLAFSVWLKPYGMVCQGSKWGDHTTINRFAETHLKPQRPAFIVHRLDKATTGIMVMAHSKSAARELSTAFEQRLTAKTYQAVVSTAWQLSDDKVTVDLDVDGKHAVSHITLLQNDVINNKALVSVKIDTGRKHQIRKHLASLNMAILGDRLYGDATTFACDLQLRAVALAFDFQNQRYRYQLPEQQYLSL
ncbi:RluA family pseudouridine synthase [Thalassotalea sp. Y01]|uniref:pseudouridine synthase family protein n=1 Tax=Thalassotalea sp. Y01 TaxID=2729613 RepID=UPI00145EFD21|nr:RluA family pseudouridine synthase [Thalassotalea sp. Y01]NMP17289.1 RluA family pseudouridine synthase [Thalassotalea sp. Y01]